jgi:hypothetical protein
MDGVSLPSSLRRRKEKMNAKLLGVAILASAFATPAFARFYVIQDKGGCVVTEKPADTSTVIGKSYKSRTEAQKAVTKFCGAVSGPGGSGNPTK